MACFFLEFRARSFPSPRVHADLPGEISVTRSQSDVFVTWGDPSVRPNPAAVKAELDKSRSLDLVGRSCLLLDTLTGKAAIAIDRFGLYPAVVQSDANGIAIASDLATMLRHRPEFADRVDHEALIALLGLGQCLGTRTPWRDVRHLPGGSLFTRAPGRRGQIAERPALKLSDWPRSPDQALDRLIDAVGRRFKAAPDTMIPLSGGLDSRLLLACAVAAGHRPETFSYGAPASADLRIAAAVAEQAGCAFSAGTIDLETDSWMVSRIARAGGGEVAVHHGHAIPGARALPQFHGRPVLTGTGSETFRSFYYERGMPGMSALGSGLLCSRLRPQAVRWAVEHIAGDRLARLSSLSPELAKPIETELLGRIGETLDAASDLARGLDAVYLDLRVGRFVAAGQQLLNRFHPRMHPFLDEAVVKGLSGLPARWKLGARFHRWAIQTLAPHLADVDWDRTARPMSDGLTIDERWPGLVARFGFRGAYAKAGAPIADYRPWACGVDTKALTETVLNLTTVYGSERGKLRRWIDGLDNLTIAGALSSIDLAAPRETQELRQAA